MSACSETPWYLKNKLTARKEKLRAALAKEHGMKCYWCKRELSTQVNGHSAVYATIDHLKKVEHGGTLHYRNCVLACRNCNTSRHNLGWIAPDNSGLTLEIHRKGKLGGRRNHIAKVNVA